MTDPGLGKVLSAIDKTRRLRARVLDPWWTPDSEEAASLAKMDQILGDIIDVLEDVARQQRRP